MPVTPFNTPELSAETIFEKSAEGRQGWSLKDDAFSAADAPTSLPAAYLRGTAAALPEVGELQLVRHLVNLSRKNFGIDIGMYPLGSCTMKYNPRLNERAAALPGFAWLHPGQPAVEIQGALQLMHELEGYLCEIFGMDAFTLQPAAGAQGEYTGLLIMKKYLEETGQLEQRRVIVIPDQAHGTNPASAAMAGFDIVTIPSTAAGKVNVEALAPHCNERLAGIMLTNPNTLGLFETDILEIQALVHKAGGLLYYDGANANAILGIARPGDMGFDIVHTNLHKTFSTPHGGGGPGSGPVGVKARLAPYLPNPRIVKVEDHYELREEPKSIGKVKSHFGNFGMHVRAYAYIRFHGPAGLRRVSELAVLNANYLMQALKDLYELPYDETCMHEFVLSADRQKDATGVRALDIGKALMDRGIHAPTVYFPLIVHEAMMIEPTETEDKASLDYFIATMRELATLAESDPATLKAAPVTLPITRPDETTAARNPNLRFCE
ncbi:MAG TPA: aminomethyl-transferring glycine dehydrogenase subunit GcvPB [bacterium]|nr:aminomethyl-transferring glycine dehydrogenase subunit GcvPB [bacterium]